MTPEELDMRLARTKENLEKNNMDAIIVNDRGEALEALRGYLFPGCTIGVGGSVTLDEIGALPLFRSGEYRFLDRYLPDLSEDDKKRIYRESLCADVYAMSANAVTETGVLYNVDGRANRCAALTYGPDTVVVVAGYNKIVRDLDEAILRVKTVAAPKNCVRLHCDTPCARTGSCISLLSEKPEMTDGCSSPRRICASYVVTGRQMTKGRIKVILVKEELGY